MSAARLELTNGLIETYGELQQKRPTFDVKAHMQAKYGHYDCRLLSIEELADLLKTLLRALKESL